MGQFKSNKSKTAPKGAKTGIKTGTKFGVKTKSGLSAKFKKSEKPLIKASIPKPVEKIIAKEKPLSKVKYKPAKEAAVGYSTPGAFTVVLWGPTNVGKSTLFNKLTQTRKAIVANRPGVTIDTHALTFDHDQIGEVRVIDSGGVGAGLTGHELKNEIEMRAMKALLDASLVLFVVDGTKEEGELAELAQTLRKYLGKTKRNIPIALVVNKADRKDFSPDEFYSLGFKIFPISAEHGKGIEDLWDYIGEQKAEIMPHANPLLEEGEERAPMETSDSPRVLILGRPNVGKSTLMNYLSGKNTSAVSAVAGTTRDFVSERAIVNQEFEVLLTDTAGMRRPGRRERDVEWVATNKIVDLSRRADVAVLVLDAAEGVTEQDSAIAGFAIDAGLSLVIAINKWDVVKEDKDTEYRFEQIERSRDLKMAFLSWCPLVRISAKTGLGVKTLKEKIFEVTQARAKRVQTSDLNTVFETRIRNKSGVSSGTGAERLYYMSQVAINPPEFVVFCNLASNRIHFSFRRHVTNVLREEFGFEGSPIKLHFKKS